MACSRNVDLRVCSDDAADLAFMEQVIFSIQETITVIPRTLFIS